MKNIFCCIKMQTLVLTRSNDHMRNSDMGRLKRRVNSLLRAAGWGVLASLALTAGTQAAVASDAGRDPAKLTILGPNYPRVFFFRASEGAAKNPNITFEQWDAEFSRLMGIMG